MTPPVLAELKWDVPSRETLVALASEPLPLGLRAGPTERSYHRDIYYDTPEGALRRRGMSCRFRVSADDRRTLRLTMPGEGSERIMRYESQVSELDGPRAMAGDSEVARRLRGLADPAQLTMSVDLEIERIRRTARAGWLRRGRFEFVYDQATVRHGGLTRSFQEVKLRRLRPGGPSLDQVARALEREHELRPLLERKIARAERLREALEREAVVRSLGSGRAVTLIAVDHGRVALRSDTGELRLPEAPGSGEEACRHLLRETFGSGVGDLALLGTAPGGEGAPLREVWLARRLRLTDDQVADGLMWLPATEVAARAGSPGLSNPGTMRALDVAVRAGLLAEATPTQRRPERPVRPPPVEDPSRYLDHRLSLLEFNARVLALAEDPRVPALERLNFLAIVSANLDEFFMVSVGALKRDAGSAPAELPAIALRVRQLGVRQQQCLREVLAHLADHKVRLLRWSDLTADQQGRLGERFRTEIFPLVNPRAITMSPGFPVPVIPQLTLCIAVVLHDAMTGPAQLAYLRLPERLARFLPVDQAHGRIPVEEVILAHLQTFYPDRDIEGGFLFRLTRAGDLELHEEEAGNLLQAIEEEVRRRPFQAITRIEIERRMPQELRERLLWELRFEPGGEGGALSDADIYEVEGLMDLRGLRELRDLAVRQGRYPPFAATDPLERDASIWDRIRAGDLLVHHPYESFASSIERFFSEAARDPQVEAIRLTLYRTGERSPIVDALLRAAQAKKEVTLFVELKARFDEATNIEWVRRLEEAGAHVVYGLVGFKNHAKVALVVRREADGVRRYVHVGTGNYNSMTARVYTDLGLFSVDPDLGADVNDLFNELTGSSRAPRASYRRIQVAPRFLLPWLLATIERETEHARAGRGGRIRAKLNGLADPEVIEALYRASQAGVEVDLVVRGLCTLRPGVPGVSERITVRSLLGRFLEHARIYAFGNAGEPAYYIASADWRPRNLRRRIELAVPVTTPAAVARLEEILTRELADPDAWELAPDGSYHRREPD